MLLIVALLLCHGALGSLHQLHGSTETSLTKVEPAEHTQHQQGHDAPDSSPAGVTDYFAAFFALLVWLAYSLSRRESMARFVSPAASVTRRSALAEISNLPRGPTPSLLQVFRL